MEVGEGGGGTLSNISATGDSQGQVTQETHPLSTKQCLLIQLVVASRLRTQNIFTVMLTMSASDIGTIEQSKVYCIQHQVSHFGIYNLILIYLRLKTIEFCFLSWVCGPRRTCIACVPPCIAESMR